MVIVGTKQNMILSAGGWVNGLILLFCSSSIYRAIQHHHPVTTVIMMTMMMGFRPPCHPPTQNMYIAKQPPTHSTIIMIA